MRVRALDQNHDWLFGKGQNDYFVNLNAIVQNINTRLLMFLGNCFFDQGAGIDWFNLLGSKNEIALNLAVSAVIVNTQYVTGILQQSINLDNKRVLTISYRVQTSYSTITGAFQYDLNGIG